jgi:2-amino-4-hydroxy-6-hydroxymethyldihydropteridine diphosphokinase
MNVFLGLGSNIGERVQNIHSAISKINERIGSVSLTSSFYETEPWGFECEDYFLNMVLSCESHLSIIDILSEITDIESALGRVRTGKGYESRIIDIDILFYGDYIFEKEGIIVPHPKLHERRFVLVPLNEIAPQFIHPVFKKSIATLLTDCDDMSIVKLTKF